MNLGSGKHPSRCASRPDIRLAAVARPARPVLAPASQSGHPLLVEEAAAPSHPAALPLLAVVGAVIPAVVEAWPYRQTCRPEAMQQGAAAVADPLALRPCRAVTSARQEAASAYPAHGLPSQWQMHSDKSAK